MIEGFRSLKRFCAKCGADIDIFEAANLRNLCLKCFVKTYGAKRSPCKATLTLCKRCHSIMVKGRWQPLDLSSEEDVVLKVKRAIESKLEKSCKLKAEISITPQDVYKLLSSDQVIIKATFSEKMHPSLELITESGNVEVKCHFSMCSTCLKIVGKKFEATIQLRGFSPEELEKIKLIVNKLILAKSGGSHNIQTGALWEEVDGGIDIKLPSVDTAHTIASTIKKYFPVHIKESYKDVGWDKSKGRPLRTLTILLRSRNT